MNANRRSLGRIAGRRRRDVPAIRLSACACFLVKNFFVAAGR
jgi:hypothetical protein